MFDYQARPDLLKGRVILVTGAGRGIGAAAAKSYAAHGATVLLLGKNEENLNQVYDQIEAAEHAQPVVIPFNLETALPHQYDELAATIEGAFGRLDGLLHNAAVLGPPSCSPAPCCRCLSSPQTLRSSSPQAVSVVRDAPIGGLMPSPSLPAKA